MRISLSQNLSYCFGVQRTLTLVEELLAKNPDKAFYMLGEVVHNEHVITDLKNKGLQVIYDLDRIDDEGTVIIQSHGAPKSVFDILKNKNIDYIDATCPMVEVIHTKIKRLEAQGYFPVVIGQKGHDEVRGIVGQVKDALIFGKPEEVIRDCFMGKGKVGVVVQSTFIRSEALAILEKIQEMVPEDEFVNTICRPTTERQSEVESVAGKYDCIVIIGSKSSANTNHLFNLASGTKSCVYLVDEPELIPDLPIPEDSTVFIASGASTPMNLIERVVSALTQRNKKST
ncbi:4-hydroxy-3-methylbut-2-enyl diphosphate reductase [Acidobacteriota bacterium]